jgi:hypothetical protein
VVKKLIESAASNQEVALSLLSAGAGCWPLQMRLYPKTCGVGLWDKERLVPGGGSVEGSAIQMHCPLCLVIAFGLDTRSRGKLANDVGLRWVGT